jgi:hypothetical protein
VRLPLRLEWSLGSGGNQRFQQAELGLVGNVGAAEVPHDVVDAEFGGVVEVVFDLVHRSGQWSAVGVDGDFGDGVVYPDHDGAGLGRARTTGTWNRALMTLVPRRMVRVWAAT